MNLVLTVLEIVAPVFALAAIGFAWERAGIEYRVQFVTQLAMTLATPCLIFTALMQAEVAPEALTAMTLASVTAHLVMLAIAWLLLKLAGLEMRTFLGPFVFGNTGNLGLPLALFAFGAEGLSLGIVFFAVSAIFVFTLGLALVAGQGGWGKVLREPIVWATVLGAAFLWNGWETPVFVTNTLELVGQMAIPMMLITLGVALARLSARNVRRAVQLALVKLGLGFAVGWGVGLGFGLTGAVFAVLVLQMSTPVPVTTYLLAEKYGRDGGADAGAVAGLVVVSTLISVLALPVILGILL
ncbi:AEC family transporter [Marimonas arenosa]|uniref:AEC family transporter n=1 Tax=Marimonas arenosa TaxID=1795305 RepID=A0AAE3WF06_9RHOB|nr:AEC family transporter [Marimonas arenosa]MDQ2090433.1 AEC family transporter [Marimonas arenosa]